MLIIEYSVYSKILDKEFVNTKEVKTMPEFTLFANSLNLNYKIISIK
jgi:hypothetical protein